MRALHWLSHILHSSCRNNDRAEYAWIETRGIDPTRIRMQLESTRLRGSGGCALTGAICADGDFRADRRSQPQVSERLGISSRLRLLGLNLLQEMSMVYTPIVALLSIARENHVVE